MLAILSVLVDALLPRSCASCRTPLSRRPEDPVGLCPSCREGIALVPSPVCPRCGQPFGDDDDPTCRRCATRPPPFRYLRAVFVYGGTARDLVLRFKHGKAFALSRPLGTLLAAVAAREGLLEGTDVVVPVPAWPPRAVQRRYSPPALLARVLGRRTDLPVDARALVRVRAPSADGHAGPRARAGRVAGAFAVRRVEAVRGKRVLVVDDVVTTGATAAEIAAVLRAAGATRVDVIAVALAAPDAV